MNRPTVSVIVPVYKAAEYLPQCIDSILKQVCQDFELILVDDGSPDSSPEICDDYAKQDRRIQVIHKKNGGVSSARNKGIEVAIGKYIVFVDSDDYIGENYLSGMLDILTKKKLEHKNVVVYSDYQPFNEDGYEERHYPEAFSVGMNDGTATTEIFRQLVFDFRVFPPYCKLYRRDIIEEYNLRFNTKIRTAEDFDFNIRYLEHVEEIIYYPSTEYMYRVGYKKYKPSNHGVLGNSEIKSAHIMANGIVSFAQKLEVYEALKKEIALWAANKHYFNRMPMLFAESKEVGIWERRKLYKQLIADETYYKAFKEGINYVEESTTKKIGKRCDCFIIWWLFYYFARRI